MSKRQKSGRRPGTLDIPKADTPIAIHVWPDSQELNAALERSILFEESQSPGLDRSNVGGWHSPMDFLLRPAAVRFSAEASSSVRSADTPHPSPPPQGGGNYGFIAVTYTSPLEGEVGA